MQAGNSYVADQFGLLAHDFGGDFRFCRDGQIGSSGGDYRQDAFGCWQVFLLKDYCSGKFVVASGGKFVRFGKSFEYIGIGPRCQDIIALGGETLEYFNYVFGGLAGAEDDFRKTPPNLPMVVNTRES
jgi:hypothetical protein